MSDKQRMNRSKKRHVAARLWTAARAFFGVGAEDPKAGLKASLEAKYTVGGPASHADSKQLLALMNPGAFIVLTPQRRDADAEGERD